MVIFLVIFAGIASKLEKVGPAFSGFNPPNPSLPFVTTDRKRIQCLKIILKKKQKKLDRYMWNSIDAKIVLAFRKKSNSVT